MLRFILAMLVLPFSSPTALAEGRTDWHGYAWQKFDVVKCMPSGPHLACPPYHQKWDWKRNQWVDIAILIDPEAGLFTLKQRLTDNDSSDDDFVCVTALLVDANGRNLIAHHQNWHISSGQVIEEAFIYSSKEMMEGQTIHIGSKQCRHGSAQDDAVYGRVLAHLPR